MKGPLSQRRVESNIGGNLFVLSLYHTTGEASIETASPHVPKSPDLNVLEKKLRLEPRQEYVLRDRFLPRLKKYDVVIFDNGPSKSIITRLIGKKLIQRSRSKTGRIGKILLLWLSIFSVLAHATQFEFEGQFTYSPIEPDTFAQGARYLTQISDSLRSTLGARLASHARGPDRLEYAAMVSYSPIAWLSANARIVQRSLLSSGTGTSEALLTGRIDAPLLSFFEAFLEFGWFERWLHLRSIPVLPAISEVSLRDRDLAARFGIHILPVRQLRLTSSVGTIEDIIVFNLNNPFMELRASWRNAGWELYGFARYKLLLGFGRLDELCIGLGLGWIPG